jgi:hypothetical protein
MMENATWWISLAILVWDSDRHIEMGVQGGSEDPTTADCPWQDRIRTYGQRRPEDVFNSQGRDAAPGCGMAED